MWQESLKPISYKTKILKFIAEQGIVSIEDINRYFHPDRDNSKAIRVTLYAMGVGHLRYYSPEVKNGVWYIKDQKHYQELDFYDADFYYFKVKKPLVHLIPHYLEMNRIRTVIEQDSGLIVERWHSETYLRALSADLRKYFCSAKIPDAIFYAKNKDGTLSKYFLEYERSLKSPQRYVEIFRTYGKREDVHDQNVIYLCEPGIASRLRAIEERQSSIGYLDSSGLNFKFIDLKAFYKNYEEKRAKLKAQVEQAMVEAKAMFVPASTV